MNKIYDGFTDFFQAVREINRKYKTPRIKMTPMVNFWLLMLRLYLIAMVGLLFYKFITLIIH
jgi:hypothetical protein